MHLPIPNGPVLCLHPCKHILITPHVMVQPIECRAAVAWEAEKPLDVTTVTVAPPQVSLSATAACICRSLARAHAPLLPLDINIAVSATIALARDNEELVRAQLLRPVLVLAETARLQICS